MVVFWPWCPTPYNQCFTFSVWSDIQTRNWEFSHNEGGIVLLNPIVDERTSMCLSCTVLPRNSSRVTISTFKGNKPRVVRSKLDSCAVVSVTVPFVRKTHRTRGFGLPHSPAFESYPNVYVRMWGYTYQVIYSTSKGLGHTQIFGNDFIEVMYVYCLIKY